MTNIDLLTDFCHWLNANKISDIKQYVDAEDAEEFLKSIEETNEQRNPNSN
jgi:hypothetical protein